LASKRPVYTTTFVLYCREAGGAWVNQGEWDETSEFEALTAAHSADDQSKWQAVRLMNVRTYPDGRAPQETISWMTGIPRAGAAKAKGRTAGGGDTPDAAPAPGVGGKPDGARAGGRNGADPAESETQAIAGHEGAPRKKRRKKIEESAGANYKKLAKMQLEAAGTIGGASSVARAAKEAAALESDAEKAKQAPMAAVVTRLVTVFIIASVITFGAKIPLDMAQRKIAASAIDIPGLMIAGYIVVFALSSLILSKILMKKGDMDVLVGLFDRMRTGEDEEDEDENSHSSLAGWRNESGTERMSHLAEEVEAEATEAAAADPEKAASTGPSGLDYPPEAVPAEPRKSMLKFLELALAAVRQQLSKLDKLGKFGLNLYLAGAGDQLAKHNGLDGAQRNGMISEAIVAIGTKKAMTGPFCDKFSDFEKDSKSKAMIDAGRSAMQRFIDGDTKAFAELPNIIEGFTSNKAVKASAQGVVIVMFTDLVGSTKMTQELGDIGAQQVVRTHNAIVRNALAAYHGREVKHTGDGIMAVFSNAANAVASTMVMQQELAKHNGTPGALPVKVRIGLNAGAAVQEEDDFFGTTVQLSARVCDKANSDQIFVTKSVRDLVTGHAIQFKPAGDYQMKGIEEPVPVFEVIWSGALQATG